MTSPWKALLAQLRRLWSATSSPGPTPAVKQRLAGDFTATRGAEESQASACTRVQNALIEGREPDDPDHLRSCPVCGMNRLLLGRLGTTELRMKTRAEGPSDELLAIIVKELASGDGLLGRYKVINPPLGKGSEGHVYRAEDRETGQQVAIKFGRNDALAGFVNAQRVVHENVCPVYHTASIGGLRFVVMRFASGGSLSDTLHRLAPRERVEIFLGICAGVAAAHAAGIVHLDLKPENVLMEGSRPLLSDFGLALLSGEQSPRNRGTPGYMAPEQEHGGVVYPTTDVFALGQILIELSDPRDRWLRRVAARATEYDPSRRYPSVGALINAVNGPRRRRQRRRVTAGGAAGVVALTAATIWAMATPPAGRRAEWHADLWGRDSIDPQAWSVAINRDGAPFPAIEANAPPSGCARNLGELIDGATFHQDWQHGYAFPGPRPLCVALDILNFCGAVSDTARLCVMKEGERARHLVQTVIDRAAVTVQPDETLGQLEPAGDCDRDYAVTITLDRPRRIIAVRSWYRQGAPTRLGVDVEVGPNRWRTVILTKENVQWTGEPFRVPRGGYGAVPVTTDLTPVTTRRVRLTFRCDKQNPIDGKQPGDPVWLDEVEVFARVSPLEAWARRLFPDR